MPKISARQQAALEAQRREQRLMLLKQFVALAIGLLLMAYFLYHTMYGTKGYLTEKHMEAEVAKAQENLDAVKEDRAKLEKRVQGLKPESIDPDLLEEQARKQLGFTKPDEKVILTPEQNYRGQ